MTAKQREDTTMRNENLWAGIGALCARPHRDGEWKYYDDASRSWWVASAREIEALGAMIRSNMPDAYSHWCSRFAGVPL